MLFGGLASYINDPYSWETYDSISMFGVGSIFCFGVLFVLIAGGLSLIYLLKKK
jgi:hypothetical protein